MSRERFEKLFPVPKDIRWDAEAGQYEPRVFWAEHYAEEHHNKYEGWLAGEASRQPEIDDLKSQITELVEVLEAFVDYDANAHGDIALIDYDELWGKAEALIAKHKGEA